MAKNTATSGFTHPLKPSELKLVMEICLRTRKSLMVWGAPGIGKSQQTQAFADAKFPLREENVELLAQMQLEADNAELPVSQAQVDKFEATLLDQKENLIDFRLSQVEPTDMRGIPVPVTYYVDNETGEHVPDHLVTSDMNVSKKAETVWAPTAALNLPADWKGIIFMDEVNGAMPIVQAACYQLFLDRKLGELELPEGAMVMAAGNRENDGGVTFNLATPLKDRMIHVELIADLKEWTNWAMDAGVHPMVVSYLQTNQADFNTLSPQNPNICGGSSPRSWVSVSETVYEFEDMFGEQADKAKERVLTAMMDGTIGDDIAARVKTHRQMVHKLPTVEEILTGKVTDFSKVADMDISKHYAVVFNLVYGILEAKKNVDNNHLSKDDYASYQDKFLRFLDKNYEKYNTELAIMAIKSLAQKKLFFSPVTVPFYQEFGKKYNALVVAASRL